LKLLSYIFLNFALVLFLGNKKALAPYKGTKAYKTPAVPPKLA